MISIPKAVRHWLQHEGTISLLKQARKSRDDVWTELQAACRNSSDPRVRSLIGQYDGYQTIINLASTGDENGNGNNQP
jgi:hypothetical protein